MNSTDDTVERLLVHDCINDCSISVGVVVCF